LPASLVVAEMVAEGTDLEHMQMIVADANRHRLDTDELRSRLGELVRAVSSVGGAPVE